MQGDEVILLVHKHSKFITSLKIAGNICMKKENYNVLPAINYGTRPKVLLVGNGINLSFDKTHKTDSIIQDEWKLAYGEELTGKDVEPIHEIWKMPFPLQVVAATKDHVQKCMTSLAYSFRKAEVSEKQKDFIRNILDANVDAVLSTNYSLEFEKATIDMCTENKVYSHYKKTRKQNNQQETFGVFQCVELPYANHPLLWHIHGTALRKKSLVMGQLYYGKLLSEVIKQANTVKSRYEAAQRGNAQIKLESWIDYFLIGDVHIFGFRLDFSESDIWWLLSFKKSAFPNTKVFFYSTGISKELKLMLKSYNVLTPDIQFYDVAEKDRYINFYEAICRQIKGELTHVNI